MKRKIGLIESKWLLYIGSAITWFMFELFSIFDNAVCEIIATVCLLCGIKSIILGMSSKGKDDEMSKYMKIYRNVTHLL